MASEPLASRPVANESVYYLIITDYNKANMKHCCIVGSGTQMIAQPYSSIQGSMSRVCWECVLMQSTEKNNMRTPVYPPPPN